MVNDEQFEAFIRGKLDEKVDVSSFVDDSVWKPALPFATGGLFI